MQRAIDPLLFDWPSAEPRLIGSRCGSCGILSFPRQASCPRCCAAGCEPIPLGTRGTLWTWTTQEFAPKSPPYRGGVAGEPFQPYAIGYVELPGEVIVESRLEARSFGALAIGMPMKLVFRPAFRDANGDEVIGYAFAKETR